MKNIECRQILGGELKAVHQALAAGNQEVRRLAGLSGMTPRRHLQYRRALLGLRNSCTDTELGVLRRSCRHLDAILKIEALKDRLLEGFVALITREALRAIPRVAWNRSDRRQADDNKRLKEDLHQEACMAFWEAVYSYANDKVYLSTYATTVIRNNLNRYALESLPSPIPADVADLARSYRQIEGQMESAGQRTEFLDVLGEMIRREPNGLSDSEIHRLKRALAVSEPMPEWDDVSPPRASVADEFEAVEHLMVRLGLTERDRVLLTVALTGEESLVTSETDLEVLNSLEIPDGDDCDCDCEEDGGV